MLLSICLSVLFVAVTANIRLYIDREPELIQNFITGLFGFLSKNCERFTICLVVVVYLKLYIPFNNVFY